MRAPEVRMWSLAAPAWRVTHPAVQGTPRGYYACTVEPLTSGQPLGHAAEIQDLKYS